MMLLHKLNDRNKRPAYLIPHFNKASWRNADNPLYRRGDNQNIYATLSVPSIVKFAEMRDRQRRSQPASYHWA